MPTAPLERLPAAPHEMSKSRRAALNPRGLRGYAQLLKEVRNTLLLGQARIEREKVLTYWKTGKLIHEHILGSKDRANYGEFVIVRLAEDLELERTVLKRCLKFARIFPKGAGRHQLSWSHYRELLVVRNEKVRLRLADEAARREWTSEQLVEKIRQASQASNGRDGTRPARASSSFKPKRGTVSAYRVVLSDVLLIDLGFSSFIEHPALKSGRFKEGSIVQAPGKNLVLLKDATAADLYTYTAEVEKAVDGDTLWLWIHAGFDLWVRQKVRLRAIDCPELNTKAGLAAKRFVESQLESVKEITVTTTKPDKFDRYLSDVWMGDVNLNQLLLESGHARPQSDSSSGWSDLNWGRF